MTISKQFTTHDGYEVPEIKGAGGGKGGGKVSPNSLFSTDFIFLTTAIGEGPVYRINPNGPQDIQIQDSSIDDLINLDSDGKANTANFDTASAYGTTTQSAIATWGDSIVSPQGFASPVTLRYGNITNIPKNYINSQETSAADWDRLVFMFSIDQLSKSDSKGNVGPYSVQVTITIYPRSAPTSTTRRIISKTTITGKTDKPVKRSIEVAIPDITKDIDGYVFTIEKSSLDSESSNISDMVSVTGWQEIEDTKQAFPRTAIVGYALKAVNEHTGGIPTFTSMTKGLLVKVPSNYNQPVLTRIAITNSYPTTYYERAGEIDWRELELPETGVYSYVTNGYCLQKPGVGTTLFDLNPQIYIGAWDGSFTYSWTQNPVWILYDILTNQTYGLGIPEKNIDKFKFYQVAQYCDACDPQTGTFIGVDGLADGSYRYKPRGKYNTVRENQIGVPNGTPIKERRFISDISITEQERGMDLLNKIAATFRGLLVYAGGKITIAIDMPNEYPAMMFNEATMKSGSFQISGTKESDIYTGVDVSYIDPTNHFKRETVRINSADSNDGTDVSEIENIANIDLFGVTRRSQAVRMAQYQLAASKYQRRNISFTTSTDALSLAPGDVISIASRSSGVAYGYGGKIARMPNLLTYTEQFDNAAWSKTAVTISANATTAPSGLVTADALIETTATSLHRIQQTSTIIQESYITLSVRVQSLTANRNIEIGLISSGNYVSTVFSPTTGAVLSSLDSLGNIFSEKTTKASGPDAYGFVTVSISVKTTGVTSISSFYGITSGTTNNYLGDGSSGLYIWGAQLEENANPTDYKAISITTIPLEHFTYPEITPEVFTSNTYPISLRVLNQVSDRLETYLVSNTVFSASNTGITNDSVNCITVTALSRFDKVSKTFVDITSTGFTANLIPTAGDLWSLGELPNLLNFYSNKVDKLFKVTNIKRETGSEEITISGVEYISNVYVDSDTFINYQPTAYVDVSSPLITPPTPDFTLTTLPRRKLDGTVVVDGVISTNTNRRGYGQKFETEYYVATPTATSLIANVTASTPLTLKAANSAALSNGNLATLVGKNGFSTPIGKINLLCNTVAVVSSTIELTIEGLSSCIDKNFNKHVLDVVNTASTRLKGYSSITIPVNAKADSIAAKNFIGYSSPYIDITSSILSYNLTTNKLVIKNDASNGGLLSSALGNPPFYISINQVLDSDFYANNSFYVGGSSYTYSNSGEIVSSMLNTIPLAIKPRNNRFVRLYVDGILQDTSIYTVNINASSSLPANIKYTAQTSESVYRVEVDYYTVPAIEVGDRLEVSYANVFYVSGTSFDSTSANYSAALTSNLIYRVDLASSPNFDLGASRFINTSLNPTGTINNVVSSSFTLDYDPTKYPGIFKLANSGIYSIEVDSSYNRKFLTDDGRLEELPIGTTSVKARNKNTIGRTSPYVQQSVVVSPIPIQKVTNLTITESLYIEQLAGVSIRITVTFDHIQNQDVTDYEIAYKLNIPEGSSALSDAYVGYLTEYNTVKVPASSVNTSDNKINFTINSVNKGDKGLPNVIQVTVTPLNRGIRGVTATASKDIVGKTAKPQNVFNFIAGQQNDTVTFLWSYPTDTAGNLLDLDLQAVEIRRLPGTIAATQANFLVAEPIVTVSAGSVRKSIPIDSYGTYTYLAVTKDTSSNYCEIPVGTTLTTSRAQRTTTVFAYSEDEPSVTFSSIPNTNAAETNFPSYANSNTGGIAYSYTSKIDNANGTATGWSAIAGAPTNLKAPSVATYITQIRDLGQEITGSVSLTTAASQEIQSTYNDQHNVIMSLTSVASTATNTLVASNIGSVLGFANALVTTGRYDSNNKTWMTGPANGNVWAVWNPGRTITDSSNSNSYALIAGLINANAIALGATYFANGKATGTNALSNITAVASPIQLVDLKQYNDYTTSTYAGELNIVTTQTFIRTTSSNVYYANGNVNTLAFSSSSDGYVPYEAGSKTFRYLQLKYVINNSIPDQYDFTLDKFRYTIDKEKTIYSNTIIYSSAPTTVDFSSAKFLYRPVITYTVLNQVDALANPVIVVTTASSNTGVSFQLVASKTGTAYSANSSANIMITAIGV